MTDQILFCDVKKLNGFAPIISQDVLPGGIIISLVKVGNTIRDQYAVDYRKGWNDGWTSDAMEFGGAELLYMTLVEENLV